MVERVLIAGGTGMIGDALSKLLISKGHEVVVLSRKPSSGAAASPRTFHWDPATGTIDAAAFDGVTAVVNLAGASIGKLPWNRAYKNELISSRIDATRTLVMHINALEAKPKVLLSGSASGWYGDAGDTLADETAPAGGGFLAKLCTDWEAEAAAVDPSVRLVLLRTGIVFSKRGGALGRLLPLIRLGVGGNLGSGKQWWPWISLTDEVRAIAHLIESESASGAFNLCAPEAARVSQIVSALAKSAGRPAVVPAPAFALRLALGEAADEMLLSSQHLSSQKLVAAGFNFEHPTLEAVSSWVLES